MAAARIGRIGMAVLLTGFLSATGHGQTPVIDADFARGDLRTLGWQVAGDWDIVRYPKTLTNSPGAVARFAANKPDGTLTKSFPEVRRAARLTLSLDYGWGWGDAGQGADMVAVMLLDGRGTAPRSKFTAPRRSGRSSESESSAASRRKSMSGRPRRSTPLTSPFGTAAASATWTSNGMRPGRGRSGAGIGIRGPAGR